MKTYVIESRRWNGEIVYSYNDAGLLVEYKALCKIDDERLMLILQHLPLTKERLLEMVKIAQKNGTLIAFYERHQQVDFGAFWAAYPRKVAKAEAQKAFAKLKEGEQSKALDYLPAYKKQADRDGVAYLYPATYLNQKRWLDATV